MTPRPIDLELPLYRDLTRPQLRTLDLPKDLKEEISLAVFGEPFSSLPTKAELHARRWSALRGEARVVGRPYRVTHEALMERVRLRAQLNARRGDGRSPSASRTLAVSDFSAWVMDHYAPTGNRPAMLMGTEEEVRVAAEKRRWSRAMREAQRAVSKAGDGDWILYLDGIRSHWSEGLPISSLTIDGKPLRGVPDLVFRERRTNRILIIEIKVSDAQLSVDGWPNLRAQLWAYSRIDRWAMAPEILLAGEVWTPGRREPLRRRTWLWNAADESLQGENRELFEAYGGVVV